MRTNGEAQPPVPAFSRAKQLQLFRLLQSTNVDLPRLHRLLNSSRPLLLKDIDRSSPPATPIKPAVEEKPPLSVVIPTDEYANFLPPREKTSDRFQDGPVPVSLKVKVDELTPLAILDRTSYTKGASVGMLLTSALYGLIRSVQSKEHRECVKIAFKRLIGKKTGTFSADKEKLITRLKYDLLASVAGMTVSGIAAAAC